MESLIENWLSAVNQPVVSGIEFQLIEILEEISDGGNFNLDECKLILKDIVEGICEHYNK